MKQPIKFSRRHFVQLAGSASLLSAAGSGFGWATKRTGGPRFAYVGSEHAIHQYSISQNGRFVLQQTMATARPVAMTISGGHLYVANGVSQYGNLPRGSVEAYTINATTGQLVLKNRVPLSLSATSPTDLAVAPNGRSMVVAVRGGGAYNVVPFAEDGRLGAVSGILKETGSGPHRLQAAAHPSAVVFDREGRVLTADQGSDKLSVFTLSNGELVVSGRWEVPAGSGPEGMVLHPDGRRVYVAHALNGSLSSYNYDENGILDGRQTLRVPAIGTVAALAIHPAGETLYSSHGNGAQVWRILANGSLEPWLRVDTVHARKLHVTEDGNGLLALCNDAVIRMEIDPATRSLATPVKVAPLSNPISIAVS
jgi:6-phosphogluconolactonase